MELSPPAVPPKSVEDNADVFLFKLFAPNGKPKILVSRANKTPLISNVDGPWGSRETQD